MLFRIFILIAGLMVSGLGNAEEQADVAASLIKAKRLRSEIRNTMRPYKVDRQLMESSQGSTSGFGLFVIGGFGGSSSSQRFESERNRNKGELYVMTMMSQNGQKVVSQLALAIENGKEIALGTQMVFDKLNQSAMNLNAASEVLDIMTPKTYELRVLLDEVELMPMTDQQNREFAELRDWSVNSGVILITIDMPGFSADTCAGEVCLDYENWMTGVDLARDAEDTFKVLEKSVVQKYLPFN